MAKFSSFLVKLGYTFKKAALLDQALTHRSAHNAHNERMEFLGDAVLGAVIAAELYARHPMASEGVLSRLRAHFVNGRALAGLAETLGIPEHLRVGPGEKKTKVGYRQSILADAFEAVIGAVYLDSDFLTVKAVILGCYSDLFDRTTKDTEIKDAKSRLQEYLQANKHALPTYTVRATGASHSPVFTAVCAVLGCAHTTSGVAETRRAAEQLAAERYLEFLNE